MFMAAPADRAGGKLAGDQRAIIGGGPFRSFIGMLQQVRQELGKRFALLCAP